jgi:mono/diheme cytochrome c family protein
LVLAASTAIMWHAPAAGQAKDDNKSAEAVKRGAYLVNKVAQCGNCHTPGNSKGELDTTRHLQGAPIWFESAKFKFEA